MLYYDRMNVSEGINANKASPSKECIIFPCWYFLDKRFTFPHVCNGCHDVLIMSINLSDIAFLNICGVDYCCIINGISKSEAVGLLTNAKLNEKSRSLQNIVYIYCVKKIGTKIITFGDIETKKRKFHHHKNLILLEDVGKMQVSSMGSSGKNIIKI